ncbi:MAG: hypothetical protein QOF13_1854 [Solirubrobacterales bacterium]|nr:hypothetical protein [Solirubrobacterales bacterium]
MRSDRLVMSVQSEIEVTLTQGVTTRLHRAVWSKCRVKLTGISGEFSTIPFQTKTNGGITGRFFEASEVSLTFFKTLPSAEIRATTPDGAGTLDIIYEIRTGADA